MKKQFTLLVLTLLPAAAIADATIYGKLAVGVEYGKAAGYAFQPDPKEKNDELFYEQYKAGMLVGDNGSFIGFKGNESLGNGLKAIWQVEQKLRLDGSADGDGAKWATRNSFVGLSGGFGTLRLGNLGTYLKDDMQKVDPWAYGDGVNGLSILSTNWLDDYVRNAIRYDSPELAGFKLTALYGVDEVRHYAAAGTRRTNQNISSLGLGFEHEGFFIDAGYVKFGSADLEPSLESEGMAGSGKKSSHYWRLETGYDNGKLALALAYGQNKIYNPSENLMKKFRDPQERDGVFDPENSLSTTEAAITVAYTFGAFTPRISYARIWGIRDEMPNEEIKKSSIDEKISQYVVGLDYALSKRTLAHVSYGLVTSAMEKASTEQTLGFGLTHSF